MQSHPSVRASLSSFFALVESQAVFAISEISRGLAIFFVGDFVTADEVAELIIIGVSARIAVAERVVFAFGKPMRARSLLMPKTRT